jgi:2-polyprenyl-3-methyl-5-hydroxy-6-metoxy-1,4-benzoquinol methylase
VLPRTTPTGPFPIQHAFVVQFAAETTLDATGITGRVEHLVSGQATRFQSVAALFAFIAARLQAVRQTSTAENAADKHLQDQSLGKEAWQEPRSADAVAEEKSMSTTLTPLSVARTDRRDALVTRLFEANLATYDLATIYLGDRLGLYTALHERGPMTAAQLAARTGTHERYIREWLEQQTVTGILDVEDAQVDAAARRYGIPAEHAEVLLERDSLSYLAPLGRFTIGVLSGLTKVLEAFKTGGGVAYPDYGVDAREGQAEANRTAFVNLLGAQWLPAIPDLHARLQADPPARVADMACGTGWSSLAMARAYPKVVVDGFDSDAASIVLAQQHARAEGLHDRVTFAVRDAADQRVQGTYDVVTIFEALHDMARPVEALRVARTLLRGGGSVLIADERVHECFTPHNTDERLFYSWSVLFCLPTGMAETPYAGTGAVMRPDTLQRYAAEAGFREVEVLPIVHDLWRFYRLYP